ncbi:UbiA family prenyltransferase [Reichenbachiella versicolor]|uniref:UbiA family prenyltransferase n=1 Tax=Reichenbachiella versicolor TaxID=1821036 RepID=UPI000D6DE0D8|nr:UbiA family prenyltransferase [Reichenbachiella versicolor]
MKALKSIYYWLRILSIDVAFGSIVMTNAISHTFGLLLPASISISLFLAVWFIYTLDHWIDARRVGNSLNMYRPSMHRHRFHQDHSRKMIVLMICQILIGLFSLLFLPVQTLYIGIVVSISVGVYFLFSLLFKVVLIKELLIASIYTIGVFVGPVSLGAANSLSGLLCMIIVFGIAFINLILITMYEMSNDRKDGSHSWAIRFGYKPSYYLLSYLIYILLVLIVVSAIYLPSSSWVLYAVFFAMVAVLYMILNRPSWFKQYERYRIYADMIFFIPAVIFF